MSYNRSRCYEASHCLFHNLLAHNTLILHTVFAHNESNKNMPGRLVLLLVLHLMHCDSEFQTTYIVHLFDYCIFY